MVALRTLKHHNVHKRTSLELFTVAGYKTLTLRSMKPGDTSLHDTILLILETSITPPLEFQGSTGLHCAYFFFYYISLKC